MANPSTQAALLRPAVAKKTHHFYLTKQTQEPIGSFGKLQATATNQETFARKSHRIRRIPLQEVLPARASLVLRPVRTFFSQGADSVSTYLESSGNPALAHSLGKGILNKFSFFFRQGTVDRIRGEALLTDFAEKTLGAATVVAAPNDRGRIAAKRTGNRNHEVSL